MSELVRRFMSLLGFVPAQDLQEALAKLQAAREASERKAAELEQALQNLDARVGKTKVVNQLSVEKMALEKQLEEAKADIERLKNQEQNLLQTDGQLLAENSVLERQLEDTKKNIEELEKQKQLSQKQKGNVVKTQMGKDVLDLPAAEPFTTDTAL